MFGRRFVLNEDTLPVVEQIGARMPGGFFLYKAEEPYELIFANRAVFDLFGCADAAEFAELTGNTFSGMVHEDDRAEVLASIDQQIAASDDDLDRVEYRIVRRDGSVRWVDDYGHLTETDAYGPIYYVFVSDITDVRERLESDMATREAVMEALSNSFHTVWMINDVRTETISLYRGDLVGETEHAAPNKEALKSMRYTQAKEYYIKTTVAESDQERLGRELSIENLRERLTEKPQFNINYLRRMDDGTERYFRIEFARVNMPGGRMGIVCGFKDVDDEVRESQATQRALEERVALQERLIEQERSRQQETQLITALASDYWSVYYVKLDTDEGICYQAHPEVDSGLEPGERFRYLETFTAYATRCITEPYREDFLRFIQPDQIRAALDDQYVISYRYMVSRGGRESWEMVKFAGVRHPEDRDDHIVHSVGCCLCDVDAETRKSLEQSQVLEDALAVAEQASRAKTTFLSNMSHEIRTPMNAIIGLDSIALNDPETSDRSRAYLEKIDTSARHLLSIINDILDMSRIESGRMVVKSEEFSFSAALEQVNTIISGQCRDKGLTYTCRVRGHVDERYVGDDMKLRQVMINILGNAVKFTPAGGSVTLTIEELKRFDGRVTLKMTFADTGIGMSEAYLPRIFEAFSQEVPGTTSSLGSTGLGMPITKSIVELMHGNIEVTSEKGVGTTFVVTLTLGEATHQEIGDAGTFDPGSLHVLVIDDDPIACEHASLVLSQVGISCETSPTAADALAKVTTQHLRREDFDIVLMDWKMPETDGLECAREIRAAAGDELPILLLTSYNFDDIVEEAEEAGIDGFVAKPLFASSVIDVFRDTFARKRAEASEQVADLTGRHLLMAEDVEINAEIMRMILATRSIEVDVATDGAKAVELFAASEVGAYDAVLMDMRMPVMDGLEATRRIRALERADARTVPIVALTANAFDEDVHRSLQAGLDAHLSKPVDPEALFDTLSHLIRP